MLYCCNCDALQIELRVRREGGDYIVEAKLCSSSNSSSNNPAAAVAGLTTDRWSQIRMAHLMEDQPTTTATATTEATAGSSSSGSTALVMAGLYACSPIAAGYKAYFHYLHLKPGRLDANGHATKPWPRFTIQKTLICSPMKMLQNLPAMLVLGKIHVWVLQPAVVV